MFDGGEKKGSWSCWLRPFWCRLDRWREGNSKKIRVRIEFHMEDSTER